MRHHEQTIEAYTRAQAGRPDILGVVIVSSVARGDERPDSDVDLYLVVSDEAYARAIRAGRVAFMTDLGVAYDGGYVDVKLASPHYLRQAAISGDDPTRASFAGARVTLDRTGDLGALIQSLSQLPPETWARRVHAYRAQLALYGGYFLGQAHDRNERFLLQHSAVHASLAAGRCALAVHHRFFRGQKYLAADVGSLALPAGFLDAWWAVLDHPAPVTGGRLITLVDEWLGDRLTGDEALSVFITDNELSWLNQTIPPEFW